MSSKQPDGQGHLPGTTSEPDIDQSASPEISNASVDAARTSTPRQPQGSGTTIGFSVTDRNFPASVGSNFDIFTGSDGSSYLLPNDLENPTVLRLGSRPADAFLRRCAAERGVILKGSELRDVSETLMAMAELARDVRDVWYRVAPIDDGIEIDIGDEEHTRIRITPGRVETITQGSTVLFWRSLSMQALPKPTNTGDVRLLAKYANLNAAEVRLLIVWIAYTLGQPKGPATSFVILFLLGPQGSGKSVLSRYIQSLIDPRSDSIRVFPRSTRDLAIAAQQAHLLVYDNTRPVPPLMSDALCMTSTGGSFTTRRLYRDSDEVSLSLQVSVLMNSIHAGADQPDVAQRSMALTCRPIDEQQRRRETDLLQEFEADRPAIFRGILDLMAAILVYLPQVEPTSPERMAAFSHWLAAAERVDGAPSGVYQGLYSSVLTSGMRDALEEHPLAASVLALVEGDSGPRWTGTPKQLLDTLTRSVGRRTAYSHDWPQTPSALSKRLRTLQVGLNRQGVDVEFGRGRERRITLTLREGSVDE